MPDEITSMSDREKALVEQVARERGVTLEEAAVQLAKEALANRMRKGTGRGPAKVYDINSRTRH